MGMFRPQRETQIDADRDHLAALVQMPARRRGSVAPGRAVHDACIALAAAVGSSAVAGSDVRRGR